MGIGPKSKKTIKWILGLGAAAVLGFAQGIGVEKVLAEKIIESLTKGSITDLIAYAAIFFLIWLEVRGMKKELITLNKMVSESFANGEKRFEALESNDLSFEHRLTQLEEYKLKVEQKLLLQTH